MTIYGAFDGGLGWPGQDLKGRAGIVFSKVLFAGQILWAASISLIRIGLLLFYRRIFSTRTFRLFTNIMIGITTCWFITNFFGTIFSYQWTRTIQNTINYPVWLIVQSASDMALDLASLLLPMFVINNLHLNTKRKFMLAGIFGLGFFCVIASIVRLGYMVQISFLTERDRQFSSTAFYCYIWSVIEPCTSIIAACLPTLAPLLKDDRGLMSLLRSVMSMFSTSRTHSSSTGVPKRGTDQDTPQGDSAYARHAWRGLHPASTERINSTTSKENQFELTPWASSGGP